MRGLDFGLEPPVGFKPTTYSLQVHYKKGAFWRNFVLNGQLI
jgi:hypothetical protein